MYISSNSTPRMADSSFKKDWNDYQHLATQGRYIAPKLFSGFHDQRIRLTTVKNQLYNPRLPSIRRIERDEVLCRLADEHCRHTTPFTAEHFQNVDPKREESFIEFSGLNWHNTGRSLLGVNETSFVQNEPSLAFGSRLRPDKSQKDSRFSPAKLYRSPSLFAKSPSATLNKPTQYSYLHSKNNVFDQSSRTRFNLNRRHSCKPTEGIFRSSSMHVDESAYPSSVVGHTDGLKSSRV